MKRDTCACLLVIWVFQPAFAETLVYAIAKTQAEDDGMKQEIKDAQKKAVKAERARDSLIAQDQPLSEQYKTL